MDRQQDERDDPKAVLTTGDGEDVGGGAKDDLEGGTTGISSMTGGDRSSGTIAGEGGRSAASPGGRTSPAGEQLGSVGKNSSGGSPAGESGGGASIGPASNGAFGSGTYNERGNVTGPDSPSGPEFQGDGSGQAQGDDLANRLGGGEETATGLTGAGAATGDLSAGRSERTDASAAGAAGGASAEDVGGMGGVRGHPAASSRPPGGMSPVKADQDRD